MNLSTSVTALILECLSLSCRVAPRTQHNEIAAATEIWRALSVVGRPLPSFAISGANSGSIDVAFPFGGPTVLIIFDEKDCFTCANIQPDSWVLGRWAASRHGRVVGIASTSHPESIRQYVERVRLPFEFGIDSNGWVARHFGSAVHPMFAIVSPNGTVLVTIPRTPAVINDPRYDPSIEKYTTALDEAVNLPLTTPVR